jgi:hypothetical protein
MASRIKVEKIEKTNALTKFNAQDGRAVHNTSSVSRNHVQQDC